MRVLELREFRGHYLADLIGPASHHQDPPVPLGRHHRLGRADLPEPAEIGDHLRRERQTVPGRQPRDLLAAGFQPFDLLVQVVVDPVHRFGKGRRVGPEHLTDLRQRHARVGEGTDLDQGHHCRRAIPPVTRGIPVRLGQQPDLVIVPHRPHRHARIRRQLTDRQHALIMPSPRLDLAGGRLRRSGAGTRRRPRCRRRRGHRRTRPGRSRCRYRLAAWRTGRGSC